MKKIFFVLITFLQYQIVMADYIAHVSMYDSSGRANYTLEPLDEKAIDLSDVKFKKTSLGSFFMIALDTSGGVWSTQANIGLNGVATNYTLKNTGLNSVKDIAAGYEHAYALSNDGFVYSTGKNANGELGLTDNSYIHSKPTWEKTNLNNIIKIKSNGYSGYALDNNGFVWSVGSNDQGQLGLGDKNDRHEFERIESVNNIIDIVSSRSNLYMLDKDGNVYSVGDNQNGQLGINKTSISEINIQNMPFNKKIQKIYAGHRSFFAIDIDNNLWVTGKNIDHQLGLTTSQNYTSPFNTGISDVKEISPAQDSSIMKKINGDFFVSGKNYFGELGLNNKNKINQWTNVGKKEFITHSDGVLALCFITSSEKIKCSGRNFIGALGLGHRDDVNNWTDVILSE